jgi:hypothetical protein
MFLFSNREHVQGIIALLQTHPPLDELEVQLNQVELSEADLQQLVEFITASSTSPAGLLLAHALYDVVKLAFRNTQILYLIMVHNLTDVKERKFCAEKLVKRLEKLKNHPAYQIHPIEYMRYEADSYRVLGLAYFEEGYSEKALPYFQQGLEVALQGPIAELVEGLERLISEATQKIQDDELLSKNLTHVIEGLNAEIIARQKELTSLLKLENVNSIQEKISEVERLDNLAEQKHLEYDRVSQQVEAAHLEIQISKTRLELLLAKVADLDQRTEKLDQINDEINTQNRRLDELKQQSAMHQAVIAEYEKAKSDQDFIEEAIIEKARQFGDMDRQAKEKMASLLELADEEQAVRVIVDDLKQQEQALHSVVAEMDENIRRAIDYAYRQKELNEEQKRIAVSLEKQNAQVTSLTKTIGELNATIDGLNKDVKRLNAQRDALFKEMKNMFSAQTSSPSAGSLD